MRRCKKCNKQFPGIAIIDGKKRNFQRRKYCLDCSPFGSGNRRKLEIPILNKEERKEKDNKKFRKYQRKTRRERKQKLVNILGGQCSNCGYNKCLGALEFHHKNMTEKEEKSFGISEKGMLSKWDKLVREVKKCKLVCANCHREIHSKEI